MTYIPVNKANTNHKSRDDNGREIARYSRYETGVIDGKNRELLAVIADQAGFDGMGFDASIGSGDDSWHVANVFDSNRRYVDTMVIGGAFDSLHAKQVADSQLHRLRGDNCVIVTNPQFDSLSDDKPDTWSMDAINKLLANPSQNKSYLPVVTAQELNAEAARVTFDAVQWDSMDGLVSHGGSDSALFLDLIRADGHKQLLEPLNLVRELELLGAEEHSFDALMDKKVRLTLLKDRLFNAMSRAGDAELSVTNVTETKPFKRQGVTNIAFIFDLSDGQKLSIWFHNPDSTPSQLKADDVMISWKWMLNKRDVTAVLSPKQGDNVQLPVLAARIMRVARKNSKKFKAAQDRAAALEQELQDAQALVDAKQGEINQLDTDIAGLNAAIDAAMAKKAEEPTTPPEMTEKEQKEKRERERVLATIKHRYTESTQPYIDAIDKAFQAQSDKKAADAAALQAETDKKEAENMKDTTEWWNTTADNVSVYLIGEAGGDNYVRIKDQRGQLNALGDPITKYEYSAMVMTQGYEDGEDGSLAEIQAFVKEKTKDKGELRLVKGADVLAMKPQADSTPASDDDDLTDAPASDDNSELSKQLADLESAVNAEGFNPADFDTKGFIELVTATADDAELTARVMAISSVYQQKLVAASMAAMTSLAGGA